MPTDSLSSLLKLRFKLNKINLDFYLGKDVVQIAKGLLGKIIVTNFYNVISSARVVETEAYMAITDRASHSFNGKRTNRNEHMYAKGGIAYVYICYGTHHLFNVVTNEANVPDAVLIRAAEPIQGIEQMLIRTGKPGLDKSLTKGPGNLCRALGICKTHSGISLSGNEMYIVDDGMVPSQIEIGVSKRIGINSAGADALLPYRFYIRGNKYVSASPVK